MTKHVVAMTFFISDYYASKTAQVTCYLINLVK